MKIRELIFFLVITTIFVFACAPSVCAMDSLDEEEITITNSEYANVIFHNGNLITMSKEQEAARATTPGTFIAPPAKAEEMYSPEVFGRSASDWVVVE